MIWVIMASMTAAATLFALWPLSRARLAATADASAASTYATSEADIAADEARGALIFADALAARARAARAALRASAAARPASAAADDSRRRAAAIFALLVVPAVALGMYARVGHPELPDRPIASRGPSPEQKLRQAVALVEAHLAKSPNDGKGWAVVAPIYLRMGRPAQAADAYRKALASLGEDAAMRADLGEALMASRPGEVTPQALAEFQKALTDGPSDKAEYYLGLAAAQSGDKAGAIARYSVVRDHAAPGSDLRLRMEAEIARLSGAAPPAATTALSGASPAELTAIRGMVAGLAARLDSNPADIEGWLRLVRAYSVLGQADAARAALAKARKQFATDPAADGRLSALGAELKL